MFDADVDYPMTAEMRSLYLKVWAGHFPHSEVSLRLHFLDCHFPSEKLPFAMSWLIRNRLTGKRFVDWVQDQCLGSNLEMHRELLRQVERESQTRRILAIKDFVV